MKTFLKFFEESPGVLSSQRLIFISGSYFSMFMCAWCFHATGHDVTATISLFTALAGVFIAGKLIQKSMEPKQTPQQPEASDK